MRGLTRVNRAQMLIFIALVALGFGFVLQLRTYEKLSERLENESEADLVEIIDHLDSEIENTRGELLNERLKLMEYRNSGNDGQVLLSETKNEIATLSKLIGSSGVKGSGIVIDIENKEKLLTGFDVRQIVEELRASGAWAISINGWRLDNRSSFWRRSGFVYVDGKKLKPGLKIEAIGPPDILYQTITLPRGVRDKLNTLKGVVVTVKKDRDIRLEEVRAKRSHRYIDSSKKTIKQ